MHFLHITFTQIFPYTALLRSLDYSMEYESRWTLLSHWPNAKGWCHLTLDLWNEVSLNKTHIHRWNLIRTLAESDYTLLQPPAELSALNAAMCHSGLGVIQSLQSNNTARSVSVFLSRFCPVVIKQVPDRILHWSLIYYFWDFLIRLASTVCYAHCGPLSRTGFNVFGFLGALDA